MTDRQAVPEHSLLDLPFQRGRGWGNGSRIDLAGGVGAQEQLSLAWQERRYEELAELRAQDMVFALPGSLPHRGAAALH